MFLESILGGASTIYRLSPKAVVFILTSLLVNACASAGGSNTPSSLPRPKVLSTQVVVDAVPDYRLAPQNVAVFVTSMDPVLTELLEEVMELHLRRKGYRLIQQDHISEAFTSLLRGRSVDPGVGKFETRPPPNPVEVAKKARADSALVLTVLTGRQQHLLQNKLNASIDRVVVTEATARLVDVSRDSFLLSMAIDSREGVSINKLGKIVVEQVVKPQ